MDASRARELLDLHRGRIERELADDTPRVQQDELDEGLEERLREELAAIERAEQRLEQGTYGVSVESGQPIPDARLEAIPWAERTTEEQQRYERGSAS
jgi:DnaK suppressor protein